MTKLFVSIPMRGYNDDDVKARMEYLCERVSELFDGDEFELIDTMWEESEPEDTKHHTYYLGKSIQALSKADFVVFDTNWREAAGCRVEYTICRLYNIPYYLIDSSDYLRRGCSDHDTYGE